MHGVLSLLSIASCAGATSSTVGEKEYVPWEFAVGAKLASPRVSTPCGCMLFQVHPVPSKCSTPRLHGSSKSKYWCSGLVVPFFYRPWFSPRFCGWPALLEDKHLLARCLAIHVPLYCTRPYIKKEWETFSECREPPNPGYTGEGTFLKKTSLINPLSHQPWSTSCDDIVNTLLAN